MDDRNAHLLQVLSWADAREHQQLGRTQGARAEHHFLRLYGKDLSAALRLDSDGLAVLEQDPPDVHLAADGKVEPVAVLAEVSDGRADPHAAEVVGWGYADARRIGAVGVLHRAEALADARLPEGSLDRRLRVGDAATHRHGPLGAVKVVVNIQVVLHLAEERQHLGIGPLGVAHGGPVVVVLGQAALHGLSVDGRAAADHLALGDVDLALLLGGHAPEGPVVLRLRGLGVAGVAVFDLVRYPVVVRVVLAGFQQQHRPVRVLRQPSCQD